MPDPQPLEVLIVGGGCAAIEAAFRLQRAGGSATETTILAPDAHFEIHAMAALVPFAAPRTPREPLAPLANAVGARLRRGRMASVDADAHHVVTEDGDTIAYDVLLIAAGAKQRPPSRHALTFGGPGSEERMHGLVQDLETGYVRRVAFVVPPGATWPVALYELALMTAERAYEVCQDSELTLLTAEPAPLAPFGQQASRAVNARLHAAGVTVLTSVDAKVATQGVVELHPGGERLRVDRVVTLPRLYGPALEGLPHDTEGFLVVDRHGRVRGVPDVYAAGDVTHHPIKQDGLACRQADAAADMIAARAGATLAPAPYAPVLEGVLTEPAAVIIGSEPGAAA